MKGMKCSSLVAPDEALGLLEFAHVLQDAHVSLFLLGLLRDLHVRLHLFKCKAKVDPGIACDDVSNLQTKKSLEGST